jgi:hypothetical protein
MIVRKVALSVALFVGLTGCTAVEFAENNPYVASAAVQAGTVKFIEKSNMPTGRADNVIIVAELAKEQLQGDSESTLEGIVSMVRGLISWDDLTQYETILLESLISSVETRLRNDIGAGLLSPQDKIRVAAFLDWTIVAAEGYKARNG